MAPAHRGRSPGGVIPSCRPVAVAVAVAVTAAALAGCDLAVEAGVNSLHSIQGLSSALLAPRLPALRATLLPRNRVWVSTFAFEAGATPLSSPAAPVAAIMLYGAAIAAAKAFVSRRGAPLDQELRIVVVAHDLALSMWSALLFAGLALTLALAFSRVGLFVVYCDPHPHRLSLSSPHPLVAFYYLNYLTKYYELLDTVLLALRGRPTPALHVFHHAATLVLCYTQLLDDTAVQWAPILLNLGVHVVMYAYYAAMTMGISISWKRRLTVAQIAQFAIDVPCCACSLALRINAERNWGWLRGANTWCRGTLRAGVWGTSLLAVYLCLFVDLHRRTAKRKAKAA